MGECVRVATAVTVVSDVRYVGVVRDERNVGVVRGIGVVRLVGNVRAKMAVIIVRDIGIISAVRVLSTSLIFFYFACLFFDPSEEY